jgi:muramidase (phage lysozyme)
MAISGTGNRGAFLDMIGKSEGTDIFPESDHGYNVLCGSLPGKQPLLFNSYLVHPRVHNEECNSDAAGRYQVMGKYFDFYRKALGLGDKVTYPSGAFSPKAQDAIAIQYFRECKALQDIDAGRVAIAIMKCKSRWASFPGANYNQLEHPLDKLIAWYKDAGGVVA